MFFFHLATIINKFVLVLQLGTEFRVCFSLSKPRSHILGLLFLLIFLLVFFRLDGSFCFDHELQMESHSHGEKVDTSGEGNGFGCDATSAMREGGVTSALGWAD